ncbi:hypothetical protein JTE90_011443 [Oedothorax gibbosus]|uniref:Methyltransferase domain-containing protein n=1 Tax=Oedothorax gibbosus TaxID=931172 RepID=A0AAV6VCY0_9ARAC|nr:hypothetical protein JTE90_011443 [Oedothorax gibbosus]
MGKHDDRFLGRSPRVFPMCRRFAGVVTYSGVVVGMAFLVCCVFWMTDFRRWGNFGVRETAGVGGRSGVDSFLLLRERERASYNRLMHYILHPQAPCLTQKIFGGKRGKNKKLDGDKVVCLEPGPGISEECIVYSFGVADEWSFEESIRDKLGCRVFAFDPSMGATDHLHSDGISFYDAGLGEFDGKIKVNGGTWKMRTLDSIVRELGHSNRTIDVLKMDIEGAEYVVLEDILAKGLLNRVNHLCVELHLGHS